MKKSLALTILIVFGAILVASLVIMNSSESGDLQLTREVNSIIKSLPDSYELYPRTGIDRNQIIQSELKPEDISEGLTVRDTNNKFEFVLVEVQKDFLDERVLTDNSYLESAVLLMKPQATSKIEDQKLVTINNIDYYLYELEFCDIPKCQNTTGEGQIYAIETEVSIVLFLNFEMNKAEFDSVLEQIEV